MGRGHTDTHTLTHSLLLFPAAEQASDAVVLTGTRAAGSCLLSEVPDRLLGTREGRWEEFTIQPLRTSVVKRQPWYLPWAPTSCLLTTVITPTVFCMLSKAAQRVCMCVYVCVHVPRCTYVHVSLASISRAWPSKSTSLCGCDQCGNSCACLSCPCAHTSVCRCTPWASSLANTLSMLPPAA